MNERARRGSTVSGAAHLRQSFFAMLHLVIGEMSYSGFDAAP